VAENRWLCFPRQQHKKHEEHTKKCHQGQFGIHVSWTELSLCWSTGQQAKGSFYISSSHLEKKKKLSLFPKLTADKYMWQLYTAGQFEDWENETFIM